MGHSYARNSGTQVLHIPDGMEFALPTCSWTNLVHYLNICKDVPGVLHVSWQESSVFLSTLISYALQVAGHPAATHHLERLLCDGAVLGVFTSKIQVHVEVETIPS